MSNQMTTACRCDRAPYVAQLTVADESGYVSAASVPLPTLASLCGTLSCERRKQRGTSNSKVLVRFWFGRSDDRGCRDTDRNVRTTALVQPAKNGRDRPASAARGGCLLPRQTVDFRGVEHGHGSALELDQPALGPFPQQLVDGLARDADDPADLLLGNGNAISRRPLRLAFREPQQRAREPRGHIEEKHFLHVLARKPQAGTE